MGLKLDANGVVSLPVSSGDKQLVNILKSKRREDIATDLLTHSPTPLSISFLSEKYFLSRSSIVEDLNKVESWLDCFSLVMIGTSTDLYPAGKQPKLDIERLKSIKQRLSIPLVLLGGSGNKDAEVAESIQHGVGKSIFPAT